MVVGINLKLLFAILAGLVEIIFAFYPYLRDIFAKKTQPHAYTWLIWAITQGTAVAGLWYGKGGWGTLGLLIGTIFVFVVFLLSLKYGTKNITKSDTAAFIAALSAIAVWWQLHSPLLAVLMVSIIDVLGYYPSLRKTFEEPWTETPITWVTFALGDILTIFALNQYNLLTLTYLITITVANLAMVTICLARRGRLLKPL